MATYTFIVNGTQVSVETEGDVRLLWVLRDLLGITGPKYGCALGVCQACTSHLNGQAFNPCAVPVSDLAATDEVLTIEGLAATVDADLHPVQQAWLDHDVAQCGFCQPGQIMTAVALIHEAIAEHRTITDADLDALRNVCRCGTYPRVRAALLDAAEVMAAAASRPTPAAAPTAVGGRLPATGGGQALGAAAAAAASAVAIRSVTRRAADSPDPDSGVV